MGNFYIKIYDNTDFYATPSWRYVFDEWVICFNLICVYPDDRQNNEIVYVMEQITQIRLITVNDREIDKELMLYDNDNIRHDEWLEF